MSRMLELVNYFSDLHFEFTGDTEHPFENNGDKQIEWVNWRLNKINGSIPDTYDKHYEELETLVAELNKAKKARTKTRVDELIVLKSRIKSILPQFEVTENTSAPPNPGAYDFEYFISKRGKAGLSFSQIIFTDEQLREKPERWRSLERHCKAFLTTYLHPLEKLLIAALEATRIYLDKERLQVNENVFDNFCSTSFKSYVVTALFDGLSDSFIENRDGKYDDFRKIFSTVSHKTAEFNQLNWISSNLDDIDYFVKKLTGEVCKSNYLKKNKYKLLANCFTYNGSQIDIKKIKNRHVPLEDVKNKIDNIIEACKSAVPQKLGKS